MNIKSSYISILVIQLIVIGVSVSHAAQISPKPGDLVTLTTDAIGPKAPCTGSEIPIRTVLNTDGTMSPLVIPEHQVLVLTSGNWSSGSSVTPNRRFRLTLLRRTDSVATAFFAGGGV